MKIIDAIGHTPPVGDYKVVFRHKDKPALLGMITFAIELQNPAAVFRGAVSSLHDLGSRLDSEAVFCVEPVPPDADPQLIRDPFYLYGMAGDETLTEGGFINALYGYTAAQGWSGRDLRKEFGERELAEVLKGIGLAGDATGVGPAIARPHYIDQDYYLDGAIDRFSPEIDQTRRLLCDLESRDRYGALFNRQPILSIERFLDTMLTSRQYMDYITLEPGDVVIDVGSRRGEEIAPFLNRMRGSGKVIAVDPFGDDFVTDYARDFVRGYAADVEFLRAAVFASDGFVKSETTLYEGTVFPQALGGSMELVADGAGEDGEPGIVCEAITLDSIIESRKLDRVDLIKMDTEGAEQYLVPGMGDVVARFRPQLAIAIYHQPRDLWTLPLAMQAYCMDYNFYCGRYSPFRFEVVFYAIPREKDANRVCRSLLSRG